MSELAMQAQEWLIKGWKSLGWGLKCFRKLEVKGKS